MSIGSSVSPSTGVVPRDPAAGSKQRLIDAAIDMILDHHRGEPDPREVFAFLNPGSIAARAGLSRGLIYHHWGDVDSDGTAAFGRFLGSVTSELWNRVTRPDDLAEMVDLLPDNVSDVIVTLSNIELERLSHTEMPLARAVLALSLYGVGGPDDTGDAVQRLGRLYELVFERVGLEPVPPLTSADIALAILCLLDGFTVNAPAMDEMARRRHVWTPQVRPLQADEGWTLFAIAVEGLVLNMTRPVTAAPATAAATPAEQLELASALSSGGSELEHAAAQAEDEQLA